MAFRNIAFIESIYANHLVSLSIVGVHDSSSEVSLGYIWGFVGVHWGYTGVHWGIIEVQ